MSAQPLDVTPKQRARAEQEPYEDARPKQLPKGVVLGPDGKPCRSCTSFASWAAMTKQQTGQSSTIASRESPPSASSSLQSLPDCPADVEQLGRATWTMLHTMAATYPTNPTPLQQFETKQFMGLFGRMYPCHACADDFRMWMRNGNEPRVSNRDEFGRWLCEAHNAVNVKLGKEEFNCNRWEERWLTGWKDGRCD